MILRRLAEAIREQKWFTVLLEIVIVVIGIFIGLQVDDRNQQRKDRADVELYLERIQVDLKTDAEFFAFLSAEANDKREALKAIKKLIATGGSQDDNPVTFFNLLGDSTNLGFEFPEVQMVTFVEMQSSGKLALVENVELRKRLAFYYQESLHRSDRIESRTTGYAAAIYEMAEPQVNLVGRSESPTKRTRTGSDKLGRAAAVESFMAVARNGGFVSLLTAEQNYTEFMIEQLELQLDDTRALQQAVGDAIGKSNL